MLKCMIDIVVLRYYDSAKRKHNTIQYSATPGIFFCNCSCRIINWRTKGINLEKCELMNKTLFNMPMLPIFSFALLPVLISIEEIKGLTQCKM